MGDISITNLKGGRNGIDSPLELPENQCVDALNVDWADGPLGRKRPGSIAVATTGGTTFGGLMSLFRHVPTGDDTLAEMWGIDDVGLTKRMAGSASFANVTLDDAWTGGRYQDIAAVTFNKKLFMAGKTAVDRLHVYDPNLASPRVRRVGFAVPLVAPTVANTGAGTYAAVARYYRVRWLQYSSPTIIRRSEPSPVSTIFTPSGGGTAARITRPTAPGEGETHWEVEVSIDGIIFFVMAGVAALTVAAPIAIATTTYDDSSVLNTWLTLTTSEESGQYQPATSCKYLATDSNRLLMAGSNEGGLSSRIYFTPVLGTSDHGDDERIVSTASVKGWVDLNEKDGGAITGLCPYTINGIVYAYKYQQTWKLLPTGDDDRPYIPRKVSPTIGCIYFKTIVQAEDANGNPICAWLSHKGPYKAGIGGLKHIGRDMEDVWFGENNYPTRFNLEAATMVAHGVYHSDLHQIWWYTAVTTVATGVGLDSPNLKLMLDVRQQITEDQYGMRGGWARHTGLSCEAVCSVMFANTLGAAMSRDLRPYIGHREPV